MAGVLSRRRARGRSGDASEGDDQGGFSLVLGGGGSVGVAYLCGVLRALEEVAGLDVRRADVMIGTSAGAIVAADLRLGRTYDDILEHAGAPRDGAPDETQHDLIPAWRSRTDFARRLVGSTWIVTRSVIPLAPSIPAPPRVLERIFPGSLFSMANGDWAHERYPEQWPERPLWQVAFDPDTSQRVVLRGDAGDWKACTLPEAVLASCAVPGILPPVHVGRHRLIDGSVRSVTNLDLAQSTGSRVVVGIAPMGFEPSEPPTYLRSLSRLHFNTQLATEAAAVRRSGTELLLLRPTGDELRHHGFNILRRDGNDAVALGAYESTARKLSTSDAGQAVALARCA